MRSVLLIKDDNGMADEILRELADRGFRVERVAAGAGDLERAEQSKPDIIVVDRLLTGIDGLAILDNLRLEQLCTPVLVVGADGTADDRTRRWRRAGGDGSPKASAVAELVARLEGLLRPAPGTRETVLRSGSLELDLIERTAHRGGRRIDLLPMEFRILECLVRHEGQVVSRAMLREEIWNCRFVANSANLIDVHMGRLRRKVDDAGECPMIQCVRGAGFMLQARVSLDCSDSARSAARCRARVVPPKGTPRHNSEQP